MARREKAVETVEEFNEILAAASKYSVIEFGRWSQSPNSLARSSFLVDGMASVEITTKYYEFVKSGKFKPCTYKFRKDGKDIILVSGGTSFETMQKYYKTPDISPDLELERKRSGSFALSASPFCGVNKKYKKGVYTVWEYDQNSAYAFSMSLPMPDTETYSRDRIVEPGEMGFLLADGLPIVSPGNFAEIVFPLRESPYKRFAEVYFKKKREGRTGKERARAKCILVESVGMLQRHNPFIRAAIVNRCNAYIKSLIDDDTLMWNTDAIYSLVPRYDLDIGGELGQFKIEHEGREMEFVGLGAYHWRGEPVKYRGIPSRWFGDDFNLLEDEIPKDKNVYTLNTKTFQIEETNK